MFRAYFDRSELGHPAEVEAVSGYLSSPEKWIEFESAWQAVLKEFGVAVFHMTDFECRHGVFEGWPQDRRTALVSRLIDVIANHVFVAIGAAVDIADYKALKAEDRAKLGHPYVICGLKAVADTLRWIDDTVAKAVATGTWKKTETTGSLGVEFVFEVGDEGAPELLKALQKEQESGMFAGRIMKVSFEAKTVGALQAADFAAYETTKQLVRTIGADERAVRKSFEAFLDRVPYLAEYFNSRSMGEVLARM